MRLHPSDLVRHQRLHEGKELVQVRALDEPKLRGPFDEALTGVIRHRLHPVRGHVVDDAEHLGDGAIGQGTLMLGTCDDLLVNNLVVRQKGELE